MIRRPQVPTRQTGVIATLVLALALTSPWPGAAQEALPDVADQPQTAVFAGGCFWGIEAVFEHVKGVTDVVSGYTGGSMTHPSYEVVSAGITGHAESVRVTYDPTQVSYAQLIEIFMRAHDPTSLNRQGPDEGTQYRSAVFFTNDEQKKIVESYVAQMEQDKVFPHKIVTQIAALKAFYPAEGYHQQYFDRHPESLYIVYNDKPKVEALKKEFPQLYQEPAQISAKK